MLKKTYTLYLWDGAAAPVGFEPALCISDAEAIRRAREILEERDDLEAVEVHFGGDMLFRIHRPRPMGWE
ncbi:MAG: hypothetical protein WDM92_16565 [Caulobacteraceae bacterium]